MNSTIKRGLSAIAGILGVSLAGQVAAVDYYAMYKIPKEDLRVEDSAIPFRYGQINNMGQVMLYDPYTLDTVLWRPGQALTRIPDLTGYALNNSGQIAGTDCPVWWSGCLQLESSGVIWQPNSPGVSVTFPNSGTVDFEGINDFGTVAGHRSTCCGKRAFIWDETRGRIDIPTLRWSDYGYGIATAINNQNQAVGYSNDYAFIWDEQTGIKNLGDLPGGVAQSRATDINDSGLVVGYSAVGNNVFGSSGDNAAFIWSADSGMVNLNGNQDIKSSSAAAINEDGKVVGTYTPANFDQPRGFVWSQPDGLRDLNSLVVAVAGDDASKGAKIQSAHDINDNGQILVSGILNGEVDYYYLTNVKSTPLCRYPYYPYWYRKRMSYSTYRYYYDKYCRI